MADGKWDSSAEWKKVKPNVTSINAGLRALYNSVRYKGYSRALDVVEANASSGKSMKFYESYDTDNDKGRIRVKVKNKAEFEKLTESEQRRFVEEMGHLYNLKTITMSGAKANEAASFETFKENITKREITDADGNIVRDENGNKIYEKMPRLTKKGLSNMYTAINKVKAVNSDFQEYGSEAINFIRDHFRISSMNPSELDALLQATIDQNTESFDMAQFSEKDKERFKKYIW